MTSSPPVKRLRQSLLSFAATGSSEPRASNGTNSDEPVQSNFYGHEVTAVDTTNAEVTAAVGNDGTDVVPSSLALELQGGVFQPMHASDIPDQTCGDKPRRFQTSCYSVTFGYHSTIGDRTFPVAAMCV